jgi:hypothetical protein
MLIKGFYANLLQCIPQRTWPFNPVLAKSCRGFIQFFMVHDLPAKPWRRFKRLKILCDRTIILKFAHALSAKFKSFSVMTIF